MNDLSCTIYLSYDKAEALALLMESFDDDSDDVTIAAIRSATRQAKAEQEDRDRRDPTRRNRN